MLMFFLFTIVSLHVVLIIPGCMSMFKVGKGRRLIPFNKNSSLKFCELERYIPAAQTQSKPQRVIVLVCRLQKSNTGETNFVKWRGTFQFDRPK